MINKCPYCGSNKFGKIETGKDNVKYVLTQIDLPSNSFLATCGLPVDAYGCEDCKGIMLMHDQLTFHQ